jgi:PKD repeat protein
MKSSILLLLLLAFASGIYSQQKPIPRIEMMPNRPSPYSMRDWKKVAAGYDSLVFNTQANGTYLPVTRISNSSGVNYPEILTIKMDTYVGQSNHGNVAEAINIIPAVVGATLCGIDKSAQEGVNWVTMIKDFFNKKNGQNVYLNGYSTSTGNDWWYEIMPNVFFYQLYDLYPNIDADFGTQFTTIADRELDVVRKLGGSEQPWTVPAMNYRAYNLLTGTPNTTSVPEPESAGSIAWLLYQAYAATGNEKYRTGAEMALDFLQNWTSNPSYEIQLPYGIYTAARMNAVEGTNYNLEKMLNWTFSSGKNTLRGWGTIVGTWNGCDVSGLIGEANDGGNDYAFSMNGFQHAAALAPVAKYDKRYARAIAKWILNLANASRLFYRNALPSDHQETASYQWSATYDKTAVVPFESMKQTWNGTSLFAMGDAVKGGWAQTDLSLYSGSSLGYMAGILDTTNVAGILRIDLNKTDFGQDNPFPSYLYYNPDAEQHTIKIQLPAGNFDVYDAISEKTVLNNAVSSGDFVLKGDSVCLLVVYPAGHSVQTNGRLKLVDGKIIDYHASYNFNNALRIKSFSVSDTLAEKSTAVQLYCLTENAGTGSMEYDWLSNGVSVGKTSTGSFNWITPSVPGTYSLACRVTAGGNTLASYPVPIKVADHVTKAPVISDIVADADMPFDLHATHKFSALLNTDEVSYSWTTSGGTISNASTSSPDWTVPAEPGIYSITLTVQNATGSATLTKQILVKDLSLASEPAPVIYYPFNADTKNKAQDAFHAVSVGAVSTTGADGTENGAYNFPSSSAYIYVPNETALNFTDKITISFWVRPDDLPASEQFILSHGSWEERYKVSITPDRKVRWTVKTTSTVVDVDADTVLTKGVYTFFTVSYNGNSIELYRNGKLSGFKPLSGAIKTTSKNITIARKDDATTDYAFKGSVDEVRIYNAELPPALLKKLPQLFSLYSPPADDSGMKVFPNPFGQSFSMQVPAAETIISVSIFDVSGKLMRRYSTNETTINPSLPEGIYLVQICTDKHTYNRKMVKYAMNDK